MKTKCTFRYFANLHPQWNNMLYSSVCGANMHAVMKKIVRLCLAHNYLLLVIDIFIVGVLFVGHFRHMCRS